MGYNAAGVGNGGTFEMETPQPDSQLLGRARTTISPSSVSSSYPCHFCCSVLHICRGRWACAARWLVCIVGLFAGPFGKLASLSSAAYGSCSLLQSAQYIDNLTERQNRQLRAVQLGLTPTGMALLWYIAWKLKFVLQPWMTRSTHWARYNLRVLLFPSANNCEFSDMKCIPDPER